MCKANSAGDSGILCKVALSAAFVTATFAMMTISREKLSLTLFGNVFESGRICSLFSVFSILITVILVSFYKKDGVVISCHLYGLGYVSLIIPIIKTHSLDSISGMVMQLLGIIIIFVMYTYINKLDLLANTDELTGLPNRRALSNYIDRKIAKRQRFAFILIDLDNFKRVNDTVGHDSGDMMLFEIAQRWRELNISKTHFFARIGGDEFVLIADLKEINTDSAEIREQVARHIVKSLSDDTFSHAFVLKGINFYVTASVGVCICPDDAASFSKLIQYADIAMYSVKNVNKQGVAVFNTLMMQEMDNNVKIESAVRDALKNNKLFLNFQPQYITSDKKLRGFETLVRMRANDGSVFSPGSFIPVAEKSMLIAEIDRWVLRTAVTMFSNCIKIDDSITLSVNVSVKYMLSDDFIGEVKSVLNETKFPPECLEIEITESLLIASLDEAVLILRDLKEMGIKIALDDFGTGYSSLSYLRTLPFDLLKIDKSFIDTLSDGKKNRDFVEAIISMGHLLDFKVISEGVEKPEQLEMLNDFKCDYIQGFVWGKPLEHSEAIKLM